MATYSGSGGGSGSSSASKKAAPKKASVSISNYGGAANYLALLNTNKTAMQKAAAYKSTPYTGGTPWLDPAQRSYVGGTSAKGPPIAKVIPPTNQHIPAWQLKLLQDANKPGGVDNPSSSVDNTIMSTGSQDNGSQDNGPSAYEQYQQMLAQFDPKKMASDQYNPQYAMLDRLNKDAQTRYGANSKSMGDMYAALQASIKGDAASISSNYDTAGRTLDQNYADTQKEVTGYQDASRAKTAELMQNLGIQAAAPVGLNTMNESGDRWNKLMAASNLSNTDANTQREASALNYNTTMGQRAGFEGANQKVDLMNGLTDFLNTNAAKRLGMQGEQSGAQSDYTMKLMDMYGQMASQQGSNDASALKAAQDQSNWQQTNDASAIKAAQDQSNWEKTFAQNQANANASANKTSQTQLTPYQKLAQTAAGYSNIWGPTDQAGMAKMITNQYQDSNGQAAFMDPNKSQSMNGAEFIRQLMQANPNIQQQQAMQDMATQFFNNMYKK